ncbi:aerolysin family beta-barrel pore-forming toxin [Clostridium tarantellae]|uniref:Aerolysin family beta-barrel pore-forming toxin n=1 Tax=Clostridium tarantellae TaxID=39493 RepID=A0A6I1MMF3_9CLOT|nr:aerolysin family beta-barrel pore-forming toxin [Clostridium tarantellae]
MTFSNFKFNFLADALSIEPVILNELEQEILAVANYTNDTDNTASIFKKILFSKLTTTSVSSSNKIATDFGVSVNVDIDIPGATESTNVSYNFSHESTFGNQSDKIESKESSDSISLEIPPKNKASIKLINNITEAKAPFKGLAIISFNVTISGFILWLKNGGCYRKNIPANPFTLGIDVPRPFQPFGFISYTFGNDTISAIADIKSQIERRNIPNNPDWDWNKALSKRNNYLLIDFIENMLVKLKENLIKLILKI